MKMKKNTPDAHTNGNGLIQIMRIGNPFITSGLKKASYIFYARSWKIKFHSLH